MQWRNAIEKRTIELNFRNLQLLKYTYTNIKQVSKLRQWGTPNENLAYFERYLKTVNTFKKKIKNASWRTLSEKLN